ncbi:unnamed protein product [Rhizoctonia solani]|uniref:Cytochrome P450 n=1 Tax=Rhizoctonia solani TaxID=456999 RepID=A0A8H3GZ10_9AGAM|nr:unnamed protein product [Rhizoctonia solani]
MLLAVISLIYVLIVFLFFRRYRKYKLAIPLPGPPPDPPSTSYLTGHFKRLFGLHGIAFQEEVFKAYGPTVRMAGILGAQFTFTLDPGVIHAVLVKDRLKFEQIQEKILISRSLFGGGLVGLRGTVYFYLVHDCRLPYLKGRNIVNNVNYFIRSSQDIILANLPIFTDVAKRACRAFDKSLSNEVIDVIPWTMAAALELIGQAGLGYSFNSFSGEKNDYGMASKSVAQLFIKLMPFIPIYPYLARLPITRDLLVWIPFSLLRQVLRATSLQNEQAEQILCERSAMLARKVSLKSGAGRGKDIITQLMEANEGLDRKAMIGHMNVFIFAGRETMSSTIARVLDILSENPRIQERLRDEVLECREADILKLPYLDAVIKEVLRFYPAAAYIYRELTFGAGQYACIGFKFAVMGIKIMTAQLIKSFKFEPSGEEYAWEVYGVQNPYLVGEEPGPTKVPKLPLKVSRI